MKYIIKLMSLILFISSLASCERDGIIVSDFDGKAPSPVIEEGTTEVSQLAYSLYEDYDLHVYYDLEGDEALETEYGEMRVTYIDSILKADEDRAIVHLELIRDMYNMLSDYRELQVYRRLILSGSSFISITANGIYKAGYNKDFQAFYGQGTQVVTNVSNAFDFDLALTKEMLLYTYFNGYIRYYFSIPSTFSAVSSSNYRLQLISRRETALFNLFTGVYDEERANEYGFVDPYACLAFSTATYPDFESYVVWIISRPKEERDVKLETYPNIKAKYDIVIETMQDEFGMDLEALSVEWQSVGI